MKPTSKRIVVDASIARSAGMTQHPVSRPLLKEVSKHWARIKTVVRVNPASPQEEAVSWLSAGAPMEKQRTLGFEPGAKGRE
jgi:hypothetical protein